MAHGRPRHALQAQVFAMTHVSSTQTGQPAVLQRESAHQIFAGCPNLVMDLQMDVVLGVFQRGQKDPENVEVRHAALLASVAFLSAADPTQLAQSMSLISPILVTLASSLPQPPLGSGSSSSPKTSNYHDLSTFLAAITPLRASHPILFAPHLLALLGFLPSLILPPVDCSPTPTVSRPFPTRAGRQGAFVFPSSMSDHDKEVNGADEHETDADDDDQRSTLRLSALEFMISLSEARPNTYGAQGLGVDGNHRQSVSRGNGRV